MSPRPDVSEERKNQILDAATQVFMQKGFDKARMDDIVEQTGLSKGTLYWYFKSKYDIIITILDRIFLDIFDKLDSQQKDGHLSASEALWQFTEDAIQDYKKMLSLMPVAYEFLALAFRNKVVQKALKQYMEHYMEVLVPIIQRGIDTGEFRPVDASEAAIAAGAIFEGTILLWVYDKELVDPEHHIRSGIKIWLAGVRA
ncbi:MAG: TetR/AcrR family transcriptional regulator [Anaerolineales bacterium]|jgi:AcrR family transcriptional regulator